MPLDEKKTLASDIVQGDSTADSMRAQLKVVLSRLGAW
jgi:hypothetical protein